jgi:hypothetical protein
MAGALKILSDSELGGVRWDPDWLIGGGTLLSGVEKNAGAREFMCSASEMLEGVAL